LTTKFWTDTNGNSMVFARDLAFAAASSGMGSGCGHPMPDMMFMFDRGPSGRLIIA
jgi:hypothetical protein